MTKSVSPSKITVSLPKITVSFKDMDTAAQNEYIKRLTDSINSYCDLVGC